MAAKTVVLVTGANGGIGFELAAQLAAKGTYHVLLGSRSVSKGQTAVDKIKSSRSPAGSVEMIHLDATDDGTISAAAEKVNQQFGHLDVLVNNAAQGGLTCPTDRQRFQEVFDTNVAGPALITDAFKPLLIASTYPKKRVINVSSGAGSIGQRLDKSSEMYGKHTAISFLPYGASKAALSMVTATQHLVLEPHGIKVLAFCPGFTASNLSHMNTVENGAKPTDEATAPLVEIIEGKRDNDGALFLKAGGHYPW